MAFRWVRLVVLTIFSHLFLHQYAQAVSGSQHATGMTTLNMHLHVKTVGQGMVSTCYDHGQGSKQHRFPFRFQLPFSQILCETAPLVAVSHERCTKLAADNCD